MKIPKSILLLLLVTACFHNLHSQVLKTDRSVHDFGQVAFWNNDTAWFSINNTGRNELLFLPTGYHPDYMTIIPKGRISPGETARVGIVFFTAEKGPFSMKIPVYVNLLEEPVVFQLKGNIRDLHPYALSACPRLGGETKEVLQKLLGIEVRNSLTGDLILPDHLEMRNREGKKQDIEYSSNKYQVLLTPGQFRTECHKKGFSDYLSVAKIEPYQDKLVIYLDPIDDLPLTETSGEFPGEMATTNRNTSSDSALITLIEDTHEHPDTSVFIRPEPPVTMPVEPEEPKPVLDNSPLDEQYKLNNIVFLLDVSNSMKKENKLENMKLAITNILRILRPEDHFSLIIYSDVPTVLVNPEYRPDADSMRKLLSTLKANGATNSGEALQLAYETATQFTLPEANNEVILVTDGLFSSGMSRKAMMEYISDRKTNDRIHLSTIGMGDNIAARDLLRNMSTYGGGSAIWQNDNDPVGALNRMIRLHSKKN